MSLIARTGRPLRHAVGRKRTGPAGAPEGGLRAIPAPSADKPGAGIRHWEIAARAGALDVVFGRTLAADQPGALWHARVLS